MYRYLPEAGDGLPGREGAFMLCSFWLVEALILAGRRSEAEAIFESILSLGGDLGLFAEELDPATGAQLGNFPQAFTHIGLINAALHFAGRTAKGDAANELVTSHNNREVAMTQREHGRESKPNIVERAVGRMMGGSTAGTNTDQPVQVIIGQEYGRTPYSAEPEKIYEQTRGQRVRLDASEYYMVTQGYLREWVCMAQCNVFIQLLKNPMLRHSMVTYRNDVCSPNLAEMKEILERGGYELPAPYNGEREARSAEELGAIESDAIDDKMLLVGHIFAVEGFMHRWNQGAAMSHRADVRDAFVRNWHRANRWHLASIAMAEKMQFIEPQPEIGIAG